MTDTAGARPMARDVLPVLSAVSSLSRSHNLIMQQVGAALRTSGISFAQFQILHLLDAAPGGALPLSVLSQRLAVHPATLTNTVNRLEDAGLVGRESHAHDRRTTMAVISDAGGLCLSRAATVVAARVRDAMAVGAIDLSLSGVGAADA